MTTISVIVPAFNEEAYIADCLQSIITHKTTNVIEVIVVDNASTDATARIAAGFPGVRVVHEKAKGLCSARQCGLQSAKGDLLAFIDADSRVTRKWFEDIELHFTKNPKSVCMSGPYAFYDLPKNQRMLTDFYWWAVAYPISLATGSVAIGGNMVMRRQAVESIGGFDTSITFYGEDSNIARRLKKVGRVDFRPSFVNSSSARRLKSLGMVKTGRIYAANFLSQVLLKKTVTTAHEDIR